MSLKRGLLLLPPALLTLSGLAVLLTSPLAWGAGDDVGLSPWMPTVSGLAFAAPALIFGAPTLVFVLQHSNGRFQGFNVDHIMGLIFFCVFAFIEFGLATRIAAEQTYESLRN